MKRNHDDDVANNLFDQSFNPVVSDQIWIGDIRYLTIGGGWMYLSVIKDLYSRRIAGWPVSKRMTTYLICKVMVITVMG